MEAGLASRSEKKYCAVTLGKPNFSAQSMKP